MLDAFVRRLKTWTRLTRRRPDRPDVRMDRLEQRMLLAGHFGDDGTYHSTGCTCSACLAIGGDVVASAPVAVDAIPTDRIAAASVNASPADDLDGDGALTLSSVGDTAFAPFSLRINFQPETSTTVPPRFRADIGREYGRRANGLTYGWAAANEAGTVDRNSARSEPLGEQYDTFAFTNGRSWSAEVPNGWYSVTVVSGDPDGFDAYYRLSAEGTPFMDAQPQNGYRWAEGQMVVRVDDGKLTIAEYAGPTLSNMAFLYIDRVQPPVEPIVGPTLDFRYDADAPVERIEAGVHREGNLVYVAGGYTADYAGITTRFDVYNVTERTWTRLADIPGAETHFSFFSDGRFLYKLGGQVGQARADGREVSAEGWKYDVDKNKWTRWFDLPEPRITAAATYHDGRVHVVAG
ncbi:MAG: kelch repeat-containing protein, partial [Planctomycetota bacterium]